MSRQKDVFDIFREKQRLLDERPSERAWRALERRLDVHRRRGRASLRWSFGMVAAALGLVAVIALVMVAIDHHPAKEAMWETYAPRQLETLPAPAGDSETYQVVEFSRLYQNLAGQPINEGDPGKKLIVATR
jgi:hypothetical protein